MSLIKQDIFDLAMIILLSQALGKAILQAYLIGKILSIRVVNWIMERKDSELLVYLFILITLLKWAEDNVFA